MTAGYSRRDLFSSTDPSWRCPYEQNVSSQAVYVFGEGERAVASLEQNDDEAVELSVLRSRQKDKRLETDSPVNRQSNVDVLYFDREVAQHDTLQGLALQYGCTVGQLLKANNLLVEQELKLHKTIKVPVRAHGLLAAQFEKERREAEDLEKKQSHARHHSPNLRVQEISIKRDMKSPSASAMSFLARMDEDLQRIKQSNRKHVGKCTDKRRDWMLNAPLIHPMKSRSAEPTVNDGNVCGITWHGWLVVVILVCILLPMVVIVMFLKGKFSFTL